MGSSLVVGVALLCSFLTSSGSFAQETKCVGLALLKGVGSVDSYFVDVSTLLGGLKAAEFEKILEIIAKEPSAPEQVKVLYHEGVAMRTHWVESLSDNELKAVARILIKRLLRDRGYLPGFSLSETPKSLEEVMVSSKVFDNIYGNLVTPGITLEFMISQSMGKAGWTSTYASLKRTSVETGVFSEMKRRFF